MDVRELYQELILDHGKRPRNASFPVRHNCEAAGKNPLCGDQITLKLYIEGDTVKDVGFEGAGCAISTAAASTMTEAIKGKTRSEVQALFSRFHDLVTGKSTEAPESLGKLAVFGGLSDYPMRVKCATLAWHTLEAALKGSDEPVTTE
jgi:nitrogen fixation NifU-like protein